MAVPQLNTALTLEERRREPDGMGGYHIVWHPLGVLWAAMRAGSGRAVGTEIGEMGRIAWRITVRGARPGDPRRPLPDQRLRMGKRIFNIDVVAEQDAEGRWLTCFAQEELAG